MKITGTITVALPEVSGVSQSGKQWRRKSYVCAYDNSTQYPKEVLFDVMGDKIDHLNIQQCGQYELEIDFSVREYNGKRYMQANAWKATRLDAQPVQQAPQKVIQQPASTDELGDPLPF